MRPTRRPAPATTCAIPGRKTSKATRTRHATRSIDSPTPCPTPISGGIGPARSSGEARSRYEEIARDLEKHLRETAPKPGQPHDPVRDAAELAERIMPLARREREVAEC